MSRPGDDWTDEDFLPPAEAHAIDATRARILAHLRAGVPREAIEDELIREGRDPEYAVRLVDSVRKAATEPPRERQPVEELDFAEGQVVCQRCGVMVPEEEAQRLRQSTYTREDDLDKWNEIERRNWLVCQECSDRMRAPRGGRILGFTVSSVAIWSLVVTLGAGFVVMLLRATGALP